jgi:hypothetical protein
VVVKLGGSDTVGLSWTVEGKTQVFVVVLWVAEKVSDCDECCGGPNNDQLTRARIKLACQDYSAIMAHDRPSVSLTESCRRKSHLCVGKRSP